MDVLLSLEETGSQLRDLSSEGSPLTETEATWLPPRGGSQLRDSAGISPDFARCRYPGQIPGLARSLAVCHQPAAGYLVTMKRILALLVAVALAALAIVKLREEDPAPEMPKGSWELADDEPST